MFCIAFCIDEQNVSLYGTVKNYVSSVYDKIGIKERNYLILKFGHIIADYDQSNEGK